MSHFQPSIFTQKQGFSNYGSHFVATNNKLKYNIEKYILKCKGVALCGGVFGGVPA